MNTFHLKIATPDGDFFDCVAEQLIVRTVNGDMGILAGHIDFAAPLGMGRAVVVSNGERRTGCCIGGIVTVMENKVTLLPISFEWADQIDVARAKASEELARSIKKDPEASDADVTLAEARLKRALVRQSVAELD